MARPNRIGQPAPASSAELKSLRAACRAHTAAALDKILALMDTGSERTQFAAAQYVLDRGWGKPAAAPDEPLEAHAPVEVPVGRSPLEVLREMQTAGRTLALVRPTAPDES